MLRTCYEQLNMTVLMFHSFTAPSRPNDNALSLFYFETQVDSFDVGCLV